MSEPAAPGRVVTRPAPFGRVVITGLVLGVIAVIPALLVYWVLRLVGVPFEAAPSLGGQPELVGSWQVIVVPVVCGVLGGALAATFRTLYHGPRVAALVLATLTLLSCVPVVLQPAAVPTSTRVGLIALHLIVGGILTWGLSRAVTSEDPPPGVLEELDARHPGSASRR